jgi:hypothetical protein
VDRFVATVEKGKSVGRVPVNEEIVEQFNFLTLLADYY